MSKLLYLCQLLCMGVFFVLFLYFEHSGDVIIVLIVECKILMWPILDEHCHLHLSLFYFSLFQPFMNPAMDIFLQMSTDSPFLPPFLESCSNETWFRTVAMVLRAPRQDIKLLERLSIVLQKLSKLR